MSCQNRLKPHQQPVQTRTDVEMTQSFYLSTSVVGLTTHTEEIPLRQVANVVSEKWIYAIT